MAEDGGNTAEQPASDPNPCPICLASFSDESYLDQCFQVFRCDVGPNGRILIKGVSVTGERKVRRKNMVFKMQTQNLCPPGEFTASFQLRGPIDHLNLSCNFGPDGIFEGVAKKKQQVL